MICERCGIGIMESHEEYYDRQKEKWGIVYRCDNCGHTAKFDRSGRRVD